MRVISPRSLLAATNPFRADMFKGAALAASVLSALSVSGCVDEDTVTTDPAALMGGNAVETPPGMHSAVGEVLTGGSCTGTLIADDLVLTAAHCVCSNDPYVCHTGPATFVLKDVRRIETPDIVENVGINGQGIAHPDFGFGQYDLAVLKLDQPVSSVVLDVTPIPLAIGAPAVGQPVTLVGMGLHGTCQEWNFGTKHHGTTTLSVINFSSGGGAQLATADDQLKACSGDSGGPMLDASGRIIGVASSVLPPNYSLYDSVWYARTWIQQQLVSPGNRLRMFAFPVNSTITSAPYQDRDAEPWMIGFNESNDLELVGDFFGVGNDQLLVFDRGSGPARFRIGDLSDGRSQMIIPFMATKAETPGFNGFLDSNDRHFVGDFLDRGHEQLLAINTSGSGNRIAIFDFSDFWLPVERPFLEPYSYPLFNGWIDWNDAIVAGDFRNSGHDQLLFVNRGGSGGRVMIADFSTGVPAQPVYWESYGDSTAFYLNGWLDTNDALVAGDFVGGGFDQALMVNRGSGAGRVLIVSFEDGVRPAEWQYYESYGQSPILDGRHDVTDFLRAGDFIGAGYDQLLLVNIDIPPATSPGRFMVADFWDRSPPAAVWFDQVAGEDPVVETRLDIDDRYHVGSFFSEARSELLSIERY